ncbi:MAG TPA: DUF2336 domain-containing protein [Roseiarcus sp.]|nr:DUF2336 domain-containing protein [Roseiarcus sp.]
MIELPPPSSTNPGLALPGDLTPPDIVRRFLAWAQCADAERRAEGASALARAYLYSELTAPARAEAALAMTALAGDVSALVRKALAAALCYSSEAPRPLILALAADVSDVAASVLQRSPVLTRADLADCAMTADAGAQVALARRPDLPPEAIAALAETGQRDAILALIGNLEIDIPAGTLTRILARFRGDPDVREALLERPSLPAALRARIVLALAEDLSIEASRWMPRERAERIARETRDQTICLIASSCRPHERAELARALRAAGALTPALLLRSLLGGDRDLFAEALADLSGLALSRVKAFIREPRGEGFAALAHRAGLKSGVLPAFRAALAAIRARRGEACEGLRLELVQTVIDECERLDNPALAKVLALLWRFAAEAALAEAGEFAREVSAPSRRLPQILDFSPVNDDEDCAPKLIADFDWTETDSAPALELRAPGAELTEDRAPRIELPRDRVAPLGDAA